MLCTHYLLLYIYPRIVLTEGLVIGVGFVIVLALSCLCLVVVWILMKFVKNGEYYDFLYISCIHLFPLTKFERNITDLFVLV